jgi:hypothetical protein
VHVEARGARPSTCALLTGEVAALPGFEAIAKIAFPPLIGLVERTDLYYVGSRMLHKPVGEGEVPVKPHELAKINVGDARVTSNASTTLTSPL